MSYVQPRTVQVVRPVSDFEFDEKNQRLTYKAKTQSKGRSVLSILLMIPLVVIATLSGCVGMMVVGDSRAKFQNDGQMLLLLAAACVVILVLLFRWGTKPKFQSIVFDAKSITINDSMYLLEHVSSIGWRASGGYVAGGSGIHGAAAMTGAALGHALSGQVHIQYGADEIPIITGLHPDHTETVYNNIIGFLRRFGYHYGS